MKLAAHSVHGLLSGFDVSGNWFSRESPSSFSEETLATRPNVVLAPTESATNIFESSPEVVLSPGTGDITGLLTGMQPGQKVFKLRVFGIEEDQELDANQSFMTAGVEIEVVRVLLFPDEEYFYVNNEMLDNHRRLLNKTTWRALVSLHSLITGPVIDDVPVRTGNIISYTASATAAVEPG